MHKTETFVSDDFIDLGLKIHNWTKSDHHQRQPIDILQVINIPKAPGDEQGCNYQVIVVYDG